MSREAERALATGDALVRLAALAGIEPDYVDAWGDRRTVPRDTLRRLLAAMGIRSNGDEEIEDSARALEEDPWRRCLPPVKTSLLSDGPPMIPVHLATSDVNHPLDWVVEEESGAVRRGSFDAASAPVADRREIDGAPVECRSFRLPVALPLGYHRLRLEGMALGGSEPPSMTLIVAPDRCHQPPALEAGARCWGLSMQLYGLQSSRNWGVGDFGDLAAAAGHAASLGADAIGANPLHGLYLANPAHASPYSPSSRLILNALYIDVEGIADFAESPAARRRVNAPAFQRRLAELRHAPLVDHAGVAECKLPILETLYRSFRKRHLRPAGDVGPSKRAREFRRFEEQRGEALERLATFEVLSDHFQRIGHGWGGWRDWPEPYRNPEAEVVRRFARRNRTRIEFFKYMQWVAEHQLAAVADRCSGAGMKIGLYLDLAVGLDRSGGEAWSTQAGLALGATVGAPPDHWNLKGQNWGQPPFNPIALRRAAYAPFIATLRANMRFTGALRIDHVLGLQRLFWIPEGEDATQGGYVRYPMEDLFRIVALESVRNRCMVVGEDLGTVPDGFRERLWQLGILSYRLLYFERGADGNLARPDEYPELAAVAVGTHDLPPFAGYWSGRDIDVRRQLDLFPSPEAEIEAMQSRPGDKQAILDALAEQGLIGGEDMARFAESDLPPDALVRAVYKYLARSPARLLIVHAEDVIGVTEQPNVPGTWDEHPNWRRKLPIEIDDLFGDERMRLVAEAIGRARARRAE